MWDSNLWSSHDKEIFHITNLFFGLRDLGPTAFLSFGFLVAFWLQQTQMNREKLGHQMLNKAKPVLAIYMFK